jgi:hypothetical protein
MARYNDIPRIRNTRNKRYYATSKYPDIPLGRNDIYVYTTIGDRLDILAQQYYNDASLWWVIAAANPTLRQDSLTPSAGAQIRIPFNVSEIISSFNTLNNQNISINVPKKKI